MPYATLRFGFTLVSAALLAACAQQQAPPPPVASSPTTAIDGAYAGIANGSCGANQSANAELRDGRFTLAVPPELNLSGQASPDGMLNASQVDDAGRELNFSGRVDGKELRGGSYNGRCAFAFSMTRTS